MRYLRLVSDIHLDFDVRRWHGTRLYDPNESQTEGDLSLVWFPEVMEGDDDTLLVIAGDLWIDHKFISRRYSDGECWLQKLAKRFKYVVFVLGNHDYWGTNLMYEDQKIIDVIGREDSPGYLPNVHLLEANHVVLDQVKLVGGTLWTNYNRGDPLCLYNAPRMMNDYQHIRYGPDYHKLKPEQLYARHVKTAEYIFSNAGRDDPAQKVVVVTHMAPSELSVDDMYKDDVMANYYYFSNLEERILNAPSIDYWLHGHMHNAKDYLLGTTRVIANPRGYAPFQRAAETGFNPCLRIDLLETS